VSGSVTSLTIRSVGKEEKIMFGDFASVLFVEEGYFWGENQRMVVKVYGPHCASTKRVLVCLIEKELEF